MENKDLMEKQELIVVEQLPIITERLKLISEEIDIEIAEVMALEVTEETIKTVKSKRAMLTKKLTVLEEKRKQVKTAIMSPYELFENVYKELVSNKFRYADNVLKNRIDDVEKKLKEQKRQEIKTYFEEYLLSKNIDFVKFENANINITLSANMKSLKEQSKAFIDHVFDDLTLIETQEYKPEILVEYKKTLNCSLAITSVKTRHEAIEREKQRQMELEEKRKIEAEAASKVQEALQTQQPLEPPKIVDAPKQEDDEILTVSFKVTHKRSKLKELKQFLVDGGYRIG